jgi:hypothetical protein
MLGSQLVDLGSQGPISAQEFGLGCLQPHMRRLELPVRRFKPFVLRPDLVVHRLEPLILGRDLLTLTADSLEFLADNIGAIVGRGPVSLKAGGPWARRIGDDKGHSTLFAADVPSNPDRPNAQYSSAVWTGHNDPLIGVHGPRQGRRRAGYATINVPSLQSHEDLVALLASDLQAEISAPNPQRGRAMRAVGEEMALDIAHGITLV